MELKYSLEKQASLFFNQFSSLPTLLANYVNDIDV